MAKGNETFTELIDAAQQLPGLFGGGTPGDGGSPFSEAMKNPQNHRVVNLDDEGKAGAVEWDYEHHSQVFTLPGDEQAYNAVQNLCLRGDALPRSEERSFWQSSGEFRVLMAWLTRTRNPEREAAAAERAREEEIDAQVGGRRRR